MIRKALSSGCTLLFILSLVFSAIFIVSFSYYVKGDMVYVGGVGANNYSTIQAGIDAADEGDTVFVYGGTYNEAIAISKSINLVGEDIGDVTIDGEDALTVVYIYSTISVNIENFKIINGNRGVYISGSDEVRVSSLNVTDCEVWAIFASYSDDLQIRDCRLSGLAKGNGIEVSYSSDLIIKNNFISNFSNGIIIKHGEMANIEGNTLYNNSDTGLLITYSTLTLESTRIEQSNYGVHQTQISSSKILNSTIVDSGIADFYVGLDELTVVNTIFDPTSVIISKSDAVLTVMNYLEVYVRDSQGNPVADADVIVLDDGSIIYDSTDEDEKTNEEGMVSLIEVVYRMYKYDAALDYVIEESVTGIQAFYDTYELPYLGLDQYNINMSTSHRETFELDSAPPELLQISSHGNMSLKPNTIDREQDDSLAVFFYANEPGSYIMIVNTSGDHEFSETNDTLFMGSATGAPQTIFCNISNESGLIPDGNYYVEFILIDSFNNVISEPYTSMIIRIINTDRDQDGYKDTDDAFPDDPTQWSDNDGDGFGDNPLGNNADAFSTDPTQWFDRDGDGYGDNTQGNKPDVFPDDKTQWLDTDGDGFGDNSSGENPDAFPYEPTQWLDSDGDGYGDNLTGNNSDAFPFDRHEWKDSDGDGYGDNSDEFPDDPKEWEDSDGDGWGDNSDFLPINHWILILIIIILVVAVLVFIMEYKRIQRAARSFEPGAVPSKPAVATAPKRELPPPPKRFAAKKKPPTKKRRPPKAKKVPVRKPSAPPPPPPAESTEESKPEPPPPPIEPGEEKEEEEKDEVKVEEKEGIEEKEGEEPKWDEEEEKEEEEEEKEGKEKEEGQEPMGDESEEGKVKEEEKGEKESEEPEKEEEEKEEEKEGEGR